MCACRCVSLWVHVCVFYEVIWELCGCMYVYMYMCLCECMCICMSVCKCDSVWVWGGEHSTSTRWVKKGTKAPGCIIHPASKSSPGCDSWGPSDGMPQMCHIWTWRFKAFLLTGIYNSQGQILARWRHSKSPLNVNFPIAICTFRIENRSYKISPVMWLEHTRHVSCVVFLTYSLSEA